MFIVNRIRGQQIDTRCPFSDITQCWKIKWSDKAQQNYSDLFDSTRKIAEKIGFSLDSHNINLDRNDSIIGQGIMMQASFIGKKYGRIEYSYLSLINPEDLPTELHLTCIEDPRLNSKEYLEKVIVWIKSFTGLTREITHPMEIEFIKGMLKMFLEPKKCLAAREFILAHEVTHLFLDHSAKEIRLFKETEGTRQLNSIGVAVVSSIACKALGYSLFPTGIIAAVIVYKTSKYVSELLYSNSLAIKHELEADATAKKLLGETGGLYLYQCAEAHSLSVLSKHPRYQQVLYRIFNYPIFNLLTSQSPTRQQCIEHLKK